MTDGNIYKNIAERTGGEIFAGIIGPVRTGKSTFIKRFMELFVVPGIENTYVRTRVVDQLPQSGDGRTITTTEPKFVPEEAVKIKVGSVSMMIRLVDCVGYLIPGVLGHLEEGKIRMVKTPWDTAEMPFEEAAERGTEKVITDHSTVGILVTCDGSFGDIPRESFVSAEEKTVNQLKALGKPFVIVLNSAEPTSVKTAELAESLRSRYEIPVIATNCMTMGREVTEQIFTHLLQQFPVSEIFIGLPEYMDALPPEHIFKSSIVDTVFSWMENLTTISSVEESYQRICGNEHIKSTEITSIEMATGRVFLRINLQDGLYFQIIEELLNHEVSGDRELFLLLQEYAKAKEAYDDMEVALAQVRQVGYGIVHPKLGQMELGQPEVFKQGNKFGVRLIATAPCLHMVRTDISTEISPIVGTEQQSEDLAGYLMEKFSSSKSGEELWNTNLFGKTLQEMVSEQMEGKLTSMPESLQGKVQRSLQKISNDGKDYFICIIL